MFVCAYHRHRRTSRRLRATPARPGMTLIEVMIAVAVLAIATSMVWAGIAQSAKTKKRMEADLDRYHVIRVTLERMAREMSMAYVSAQVNPSPALQQVVTAFVGKDRSRGDRIDFTSFSHQRLMRDSHESDQNEIGYFITDHPEKSGVKVLARRESARIDDDPLKGGEIEILIEDVLDFQLEYLDPRSLEWQRKWDTTQGAGQPNQLPSQVKIALTIPHPTKRKKKLTLGTRATLFMTYGLNHAVYK